MQVARKHEYQDLFLGFIQHEHRTMIHTMLKMKKIIN